MNEINDGGPAFGQVVELRCVRVEMNGDTEWEPEAMVHGGLTIRDYFAAKAMVALINNEFCAQGINEIVASGKATRDDLIAAVAYTQADAMLRARGEA